MTRKIYEVLFKPYSDEVHGYTFFTPDGKRYFVLNSILPKADAENALIALYEASAHVMGGKFVLLKSNGQIYKSNNSKYRKDGAA